MMALLTVCMGFFMVSLDATVVNVALNSLRVSLHIGLSGLQWTVDSYTLSFAALLLSAGALGDRMGPKKVFCFGLLLFSLASALCGIASSLPFLIIARVLQGIGAALLVATSLSILQRIFVEPSARARAFGVWGGIGGVAVAAGPVLGGFLISLFGWPSVFLLNVPFGIAGLYMASRYLPDMHGTPRQIKIAAQATSAVALGALAYTFIAAGSHGWNTTSVIFSAILFVIAAIAFLTVEIVAEAPMLPKGIFRVRSFTAAALVGVIINFGFYGQLFVLSLYFQQVRGYSALETGCALLPQAIVCALTAFICGKVTAKTGPGLPMTIGLFAGFSGLVGLAFISATSPYMTILIPMLAVGFGMSFTAPATIAAAMSSASSAQSGMISGIINATRQSGSVMGIAVLGSLIAHQATFAWGMSAAFAIAATLFFVGLSFTVFWILPRRVASARCERAESTNK